MEYLAIYFITLILYFVSLVVCSVFETIWGYAPRNWYLILVAGLCPGVNVLITFFMVRDLYLCRHKYN